AGEGYDVRADCDVKAEGAVDVVLADGKALERGKRGKAGAEIVDRDAHAQAVHAAQQAGDMVDIVHRRRLGQLDLEQLGADAGITHGIGDDLGDAIIQTLSRRDINGYRDHRQPGIQPQLELLRRAMQGPHADVDDEADLLRHRDEVVRRHLAAPRPRPAQQGLHADQAAGGQRNLRLEVEVELVLLQGLAQRAFDIDGVAAAHGMAVEAAAAVAAQLAARHRRVGHGQEFVDIDAVGRRQADAYAAVHAQTDAVDVHRRIDGRRDLLRNLARRLAPADLVEQYDILVPAPARHALGLADHLLETMRDLDQDGVADIVAEAVVDAIEVIDV